MLEFHKNYRKSPALLAAAALFLAGCEVGSSTKGKAPFRAPSGGTSTAAPGATTVEVATPFTVSVVVKDKSGFGIPNVTPTVTASGATSGTTGVTTQGCTVTDRKGISTCTLTATRAQYTAPATGEVYTVSVLTPVRITAAATVTVQSIPRTLRFKQQPAATSAVAAAPMNAQPKLELLDKAGTILDYANIGGTGVVTMSIGSATDATGVLGGDTTEGFDNGSDDFDFTVTGADVTSNDLTINKTGTYTLLATLADNLSGTSITATSSSFTVTAGTASALKFKVQPSTTAATNVAFGTQPIVVQVDANLNEVTTDDSCIVTLTLINGTDTLEAGDQLLASSVTLTMVDGVANYGDPTQSLRIKRIGLTSSPRKYKLRATASGICNGTVNGQTVDSDDISISLALMPYQLQVIQPPSISALNESWVNQPIVGVFDINGALITSDNSTSVIMDQPTGTAPLGQLVGATTLQVTSGVAAFSGLKIFSGNVNHGNKVSTYPFRGINPPLTIQSASTTQYVSQNGFTPAALQFRVQPTSVARNEQLGVVEVKTVDTDGFFCFNDNSSSVQLMYRIGDTGSDGTMENGPGFALGQEECNGNAPAATDCPVTAAQTVVNGIAAFSGFNFTTQGAKRILAYDATTNGPTEIHNENSCVVGGALCGILSDIFAVNSHSTKNKLAFECGNANSCRQPADAAGGGSWTTQPYVSVLDKFGNVVTTDNTTVITMSCVHVLGCGLNGQVQVQVSNGTARFQGLFIDQSTTADVSDIILEATATGLIKVRSNAFTETP